MEASVAFQGALGCIQLLVVGVWHPVVRCIIVQDEPVWRHPGYSLFVLQVRRLLLYMSFWLMRPPTHELMRLETLGGVTEWLSVVSAVLGFHD